MNMGTVVGNGSNTSIEDSSKYLNSLQYLIGSSEYKNINYSLTNVNVFKFDNALFKTPMPNPGIIQQANISILTEEPDALSSLNWFSNIETLEPLVKESSEFLKLYLNQTLCELIDIKIESSINILYVNRIPEIFKEIILEIIKKLNLKFDLIYIKEETFYLNQFLFSIMKIFPNLKEITYYSNDFSNYIIDKHPVQNNNNNSIEYFKIEVPFQFSYLLPRQERHLLDKIVLKTMLNNAESKLIISTGVFWSLYRLDFDSKMSLLRIFNNRQRIETSSDEAFDALTFNCDGLLIGKNQLSLKTLKLLGGYNKSVVLTPSFFGFIKDRIYAVKVIINDESAQHLHDAIVIIARSADATLIEANDINNWTVVDEYISLSAKVSYNRRLKLNVDGV